MTQKMAANWRGCNDNRQAQCFQKWTKHREINSNWSTFGLSHRDRCFQLENIFYIDLYIFKYSNTDNLLFLIKPSFDWKIFCSFKQNKSKLRWESSHVHLPGDKYGNYIKHEVTQFSCHGRSIINTCSLHELGQQRRSVYYIKFIMNPA